MISGEENIQMDTITHFTDEEKTCKILEDNANGLPKYDFMSAIEIAQYLDIGKSQAYEICKVINEKLAAQGFLTFRGKVPRQALLDQLPKQ